MLPEETAKNASLLLERCIFGEIYCQNADTGNWEEWKQKSIRKKVDLERSVRYLAFEKRFLESHKKSVLFGVVVTFGPYFAA